MDIRNVYIIFAKEFTKLEIVNDLKVEKYDHNFIFGCDLQSTQDKDSYLAIAQEVWTFGKCENIQDYNMARARGKDLWKMK